MKRLVQRFSLPGTLIAFSILLLPPIQHVLDGSMTVQMLLQIPLLIGTGYLLSHTALARQLGQSVAGWNYNGISGLLLASLALIFWMLPRSLDAATGEPAMIAAKFITIPLLIGLPLGLSWPRTTFVIRGFFLAELIAMFFRLGWLYMISPVRFCNNYLLDDQQRSGEYMLVIGGATLAWVVIKLLCGHFKLLRNDASSASSDGCMTSKDYLH